MTRLFLLPALAAIAPAAPAIAQTMDHSMHMPGASGAQGPHAGHHMPEAMPGQPKSGEAPPSGNAPPPAASGDWAADRYFGAEAMAASREALRREHGGGAFRQIIFNIAEHQARKGRDGYRWDGEAWIGGDINRLTLKTEGEGAFGRSLERGEVQALYSRALDPYWNLQAGVRYDFKPDPSRVYATIGVEGLAPYWFEVEGALFLSDKGDVLARAEAYCDQRITQSLVLQPRVEMNFAAQDVPENGVGSGLSDIELGLRLRYEKVREFAPYVGVTYERKLGDSGRMARARGDEKGGFGFVAGVRTWF